MGARDDVVEWLEKASLAFDEAGQIERAAAIMRVADALRDLHPGLVDDLVEEIIANMRWCA